MRAEGGVEERELSEEERREDVERGERVERMRGGAARGSAGGGVVERAGDKKLRKQVRDMATQQKNNKTSVLSKASYTNTGTCK